MHWKFEEYNDPENDTKVDDITDRFFKEKNLFDNFLRESIQNSIDVIDDRSKPVEFKIRYLKEPLYYLKWCNFKSLRKHLLQCKFTARPKESDNVVPFIIIEDFNTVGLDGDNRDGFLKAVGKSDKFEGGGSHGIGKTTLNALSEIRTFYYFSRFGKIPRLANKLVGGRSVLKSHGEQYRPYGNLDLNPLIASFRVDLSRVFLRKEDKRTGLSVAIPFPNISSKDIDTAANFRQLVMKGLAENYYLPILEKQLSVTTRHKTDKEEILDINAIRNYLKPSKLKKHRGILEKIEMLTHADESKYIELKSNIDPSDWSEGSIPEQLRQQIADTKDEFNNYKKTYKIRLIIDLPQSSKGYLTLYIARSKSQDNHRVDFWRDHLLISSISKSSKHNLNSIVVVRKEGYMENPLNSLLRSLEGVSHNSWQTGNIDFNIVDEYGFESEKSVTALIEYIEKLPNDIENLLAPPRESIKDNPFAEYFSRPKTGPDNIKSSPLGVELIPRTPQIPSDFLLKYLHNGFIISIKPDKFKDEFISIVEIAYSLGVGRGNAFKNYHKNDFDIHNLDLQYRFCRLLKADSNKLRCKILSQDFYIKLTGFDQHRELDIDIKADKEG